MSNSKSRRYEMECEVVEIRELIRLPTGTHAKLSVRMRDGSQAYLDVRNGWLRQAKTFRPGEKIWVQFRIHGSEKGSKSYNNLRVLAMRRVNKREMLWTRLLYKLRWRR